MHALGGFRAHPHAPSQAGLGLNPTQNGFHSGSLGNSRKSKRRKPFLHVAYFTPSSQILVCSTTLNCISATDLVTRTDKTRTSYCVHVTLYSTIDARNNTCRSSSRLLADGTVSQSPVRAVCGAFSGSSPAPRDVLQLRLSGDALLSAATCSLPVFLLGERLPSCSVQAREEAR